MYVLFSFSVLHHKNFDSFMLFFCSLVLGTQISYPAEISLIIRNRKDCTYVVGVTKTVISEALDVKNMYIYFKASSHGIIIDNTSSDEYLISASSLFAIG